MIRRRRTVPEAELLSVIGQRDAARQDVTTLTRALRAALATIDDERREAAALEERADALGAALQVEHADGVALRRQVDALDRWSRSSPAQIAAICSDAEHWRTLTVPPSGLLSGEVSPGAAPCGPLVPASTAETSLSTPADAPADGGTVTS
jgi:hypothetical protein